MRRRSPRTDARICRRVHRPNVFGFKEHDKVEEYVDAEFVRTLEWELEDARAPGVCCGNYETCGRPCVPANRYWRERYSILDRHLRTGRYMMALVLLSLLGFSIGALLR